MGQDSDIAIIGRAMKERRKERGIRNLAAADPTGWTRHTEHHWSRDFLGQRLNYWPSRNRWQWGGRVMAGDVNAWMARKTTAANLETPNA